jgi:murein DD-endopeptidase MepM/ murein hydrolase activator NlpD
MMKFHALSTAALAATLAVACTLELPEDSAGAPDMLEVDTDEAALAAPASEITASPAGAGDQRTAYGTARHERAPDNVDNMAALSEEPGFDHHADDPSASAAAASRIAPGPGTLSCNAADLTLITWPLSGTNGRAWMINNYVDLDSVASQLLDYLGFTGNLARTYDGHRGIDIDISSFREMDAGTAVVRAAAPGVVEFVREDQFDRNTSCTGTWNVVRIRHGNGYDTVYGHLKQNSVVVAVGDSVAAGQVIGVAGSSGCSTQPHLHLEVQNCSDIAVESFDLGMWASPPAYNPASDVMDVMLRKGGFSSANQIKDPVANPALFQPGETLGIGLSMAGRGGDDVDLTLIAPDGTTDSWSWAIGGAARYSHRYPYWNKTVGTTPGTWTLRVFVNGSLRATRSFGVSNYTSGSAEVARHGVSAASYQTVFTDIVTAGYRPVWIDGYNAGNSAYINAIFRPGNGHAWVARHGLTGAQYQSEVNTWTGAGYRLLHVDSYLENGSVRYAAIFTQQPGPGWVAYHGATEAQHQSFFNTYTSQGYREVVASVVSIGGTRYVTALYDQANVGGWVALHAIPASNYQTTFDAQINAGRRLHYLDAYVHDGAVYYSAIFNATSYGGWAARHALSFLGYQNEWSDWTDAGYLTRLVTGHYSGSHQYAGLWTH